MRAAIGRVAAVPPLRSFPRTPESRSGRQKAQTEKERGRTGAIFQRGRADSAENSWFPRIFARKSLILEASAAISCPVFATSRVVFATSPVFGPFATALFFSLSKSLKKKKKEYVQEQEINRKDAPRVRGVSPRVAEAAYYLGHELERGATCFSWQLVAHEIFKNQQLIQEKPPVP
ncbi:Baseplate J family protein [Burkholderia pseudomallei]|uniref:Baseplate J family protein n=1 Tax=Burkholderia pseudomallei TaxID=28450 RepID=UPI0018A24190|nr:Baseplate J family protein [Burkholderia pseudomallei]